jgi:hypothetical protein
MKIKQKYQSELLGVLHQDALADYQLGIISEAEMEEYDADCLVHDPTPKAPGTRKAPYPPSNSDFKM